MFKNQEISWRPPGSRRLFGAFVGFTPDGKVRVRRGPTVLVLPNDEVTWEMG